MQGTTRRFFPWISILWGSRMMSICCWRRTLRRWGSVCVRFLFTNYTYDGLESIYEQYRQGPRCFLLLNSLFVLKRIYWAFARFLGSLLYVPQMCLQRISGYSACCVHNCTLYNKSRSALLALPGAAERCTPSARLHDSRHMRRTDDAGSCGDGKCLVFYQG